MQNTLQNKGKLFAQYWGQKILFYNDNKHGIPVKARKVDGYWLLKDAYLQLKPLSQITDEHAIEVAKIACGEKVFRQRENIIDTPDGRHKDVTYVLVERFINHPEIMEWKEYALIQIDHDDCDVITGIKDEIGCWNDAYTDNYIHITDYLRSKGYALPYNGLSVEQLIKFGWIKLKE